MARVSEGPYRLPRNPAWEEFHPVTGEAIAAMGAHSEHAEAAVAHAHQAKASAHERGNVARMRKTSAEVVVSEAMQARVQSGDITDRPLTLAKATGGRISLMRAAARRAEAEGGTTVPGSGWYFGHGKDVLARADEAKATPTSHFEAAQQLAASTVLSPMTDPEMERRAYSGVLSERETPGTAKEVIGGIKQGSGHPILLSQGGKKEASLELARGDVEPSEVLDPRTAPKLNAYTQATISAVGSDFSRESRVAETTNLAGVPRSYDIQSPVEQEYHMRMGMLQEHLATPGGGYQQTLDFGLRHAQTEADVATALGRPVASGAESVPSILSSQHPTAEDTWMHSISVGQRTEPFPETPRSSPAKYLASTKGWSPADAFGARPEGKEGPRIHPDVGVKTSTPAVHAFNELATRRAAARLSRSAGFPVPSVGVQETTWTEQRRQAGADAPYNQAAEAGVKAEKTHARSEAKAEREHAKKQKTLPGL